MKKIRKKIKSKEDFDRMINLLLERVKSNQPISDNGMIDGLIIGFLCSTSFAMDLFTDNEMGRVLDGTLQKLEQITIWVSNNEDEICHILSTKKKI